MCGFELLLLGKNQKVFKVQATLMNTLWVQCIPGHLIGWLFFSVLFSGDQGIFCFVRGFILERSQDSAYSHTQGTLRYHWLQGNLILRANHQTGFATDLKNSRQKSFNEYRSSCTLFYSLRRVVFWVNLVTDIFWSLLVVRKCSIKMLGNWFRMRLFGLFWYIYIYLRKCNGRWYQNNEALKEEKITYSGSLSLRKARHGSNSLKELGN